MNDTEYSEEVKVNFSDGSFLAFKMARIEIDEDLFIIHSEMLGELTFSYSNVSKFKIKDFLPENPETD